MKKWHKQEIIFAVVVLIVGIGILASISYYIRTQPGITGFIIAEGGRITKADVIPGEDALLWQGLYGNMSGITGSDYYDIIQGTGNVSYTDINVKRCYNTEIYATTLSNITWSSVAAAQPSDVDAYLGINANNSFSGSSVFTAQKSFNVNGNNMSLYYTTTNSGSGVYDLGILKQGSTLIFVTYPLNNSKAFDNSTADYQLMLPVPAGQTDRYYFFTDPADSALCTAQPEFTGLENVTANEGEEISFMLQGYDAEAEAISFSSDYEHNNLTITALTNTSAVVNWTPNNYFAGPNNVTFYVEDEAGAVTSEQINIFVNPVNDAPVMRPLADIAGYVHIPLLQNIHSHDIDNRNNYSADDNIIEFGSLPQLNWLNLEAVYNATAGDYYGIINFTPLTSHKGEWLISIIVTDVISSDSENITLYIGYCGDYDAGGEPRCDSDYETCSSCPEDCGQCQADESRRMTLMIPYRNCPGIEMTIKALELYDRATCENMGRIVDGYEICDNASSVNIDIFYLKNNAWEKIESLTTNEDGYTNYTPGEPGDYKLAADKRSFFNAYRYFSVDRCIELEQQKELAADINKTTGETETDKTEEKLPEEEKPISMIEELAGASLPVKVAYIMIVSLLGLGFIRVSTVYYRKNKDSKAWIVKAGIFVVKTKKVLKKIWRKFLDFIGF